MQRKLFLLFSCFVFLLLQACKQTSIGPSQTIKVLTDKVELLSGMKTEFEKAHPTVTLNLVQIPDSVNQTARQSLKEYSDALNTYVTNNDFDLITFSTGSVYEVLTSNKLLASLEPYIKSNDSILKDMPLGLVESIRSKSENHNLYGLPVVIDVPFLVYNKRLFDNYQIPYLKKSMSWDEFFTLINRFDGTNGQVYGLSQISPSELLYRAAYSSGLLTLDQGRMKFQDPAWAKLTREIVKGYQKGSIFGGNLDIGKGTPQEIIKSDPFFSGKSAMTFGNFDTIITLLNLGQYGANPFPFGISLLPYGPNQTRVAGFGSNLLFGLLSKSKEKDVAWEFIGFSQSTEAQTSLLNEYMSKKQQIGYFQIPLLTNKNVLSKELTGQTDLSPIWDLRTQQDTRKPWPSAAIIGFDNEVPSQLEAAIRNKKRIDDVLQDLQDKSTIWLQQND